MTLSNVDGSLALWADAGAPARSEDQGNAEAELSHSHNLDSALCLICIHKTYLTCGGSKQIKIYFMANT